jgi:hypothetical protein
LPGGRSELTASYLAVKRISKRLVLASPGGRSELTASYLAVKRMSERLVLALLCRIAEVGDPVSPLRSVRRGFVLAMLR